MIERSLEAITHRLFVIVVHGQDRHILGRFIKAEQTGKWNLHQRTVRMMLPYFLAVGHTLYGKSAHVYLNNMLELEKKHPDVHTSFKLGKLLIRRCDRHWAGSSSDLVIEQLLMRSVKVTGGLTHGRELTETQRLVWLLSMPASSVVTCALQDLTAVTHNTSDQHKEATRARQERDSKDTEELLTFLQNRDPFTDARCLRTISSGVTADNKLNVDKANETGSQTLNQ